MILLMLLDSLGVPISTILAFGGIGGLAISFAAKDTLSNIIGGMMIYWDRPFSIGDWIVSQDKKIQGTVREIGWRLTKIETFENRPLYIPNGLFSNLCVENGSRMTNRRIKFVFGLRYEDVNKIEPILKQVSDSLLSNEDLDLKQTCFVNFIEFGDSALNIMLYAFTKTVNRVKFLEVQQKIMLSVMKIVEENKAGLAFPSRTIYKG